MKNRKNGLASGMATGLVEAKAILGDGAPFPAASSAGIARSASCVPWTSAKRNVRRVAGAFVTGSRTSMSSGPWSTPRSPLTQMAVPPYSASRRSRAACGKSEVIRVLLLPRLSG